MPASAEIYRTQGAGTCKFACIVSQAHREIILGTAA
jgi:hypothetical protein